MIHETLNSSSAPYGVSFGVFPHHPSESAIPWWFHSLSKRFKPREAISWKESIHSLRLDGSSSVVGGSVDPLMSSESQNLETFWWEMVVLFCFNILSSSCCYQITPSHKISWVEEMTKYQSDWHERILNLKVFEKLILQEVFPSSKS